MFNDPQALLPWSAAHLHLYQGLYLLYAASQVLLLSVPALLWRASDRRASWLFGAVWGTGAVVLSIASLAVLYAVARTSSAAYVSAGDDVARFAVIASHNVAADIAKDIRLFADLLFGGWLVVTGALLVRDRGSRGWWALVAVGGWTLVVAVWKLFDPTTSLEDWLGFIVSAGQVGLGAALLRRSPVRG